MYLSMCVRRCGDHALVNVALSKRLAGLTGLAGERPVGGPMAAVLLPHGGCAR
jgi:hypothetical protein